MDADIMRTEQIQLTKLIAADGMVLTDGTSYGHIVFLGENDAIDRWKEILESDVPSKESTDDSYLVE